jgi:prepilin-type N-terminal cleavage/methylation domain-containing protein
MTLGQKGFTILEVLISLSISAFLILIVMSQNLSFVQQQLYSVTHSNLAQDSILDASYLSQVIENSGGGAVRSWMSVWVDNGCPSRSGFPDCLTSSDRLTVVDSQTTPLDCPISAQATPNSMILQGNLCTASNLFNGAYGQQLMLVLGNSYSQVYVTAYDAATQTLTYAAGPASPNDSAAADWSKGTVSVVQVRTYYVSTSSNQLMVFSDTDHTGIANPANTSTLADYVFDLQAALGVDLQGNNILTDTNSNTDEWLYNAAGDAPLFPSYSNNQIKMIEVGLISGVSNKYKKTASQGVIQILDGPNRQSQLAAQGLYDLKAISFKVGPRNN